MSPPGHVRVQGEERERERWQGEVARSRAEDPLWTLPSEAFIVPGRNDPLLFWLVEDPPITPRHCPGAEAPIHPSHWRIGATPAVTDLPTYADQIIIKGISLPPTDANNESLAIRHLQEVWAPSGGKGGLAFLKGSIIIGWKEPATEEVLENFISNLKEVIRKGLRSANPYSWWRGISPPELIYATRSAPTSAWNGGDQVRTPFNTTTPPPPQSVNLL